MEVSGVLVVVVLGFGQRCREHDRENEIGQTDIDGGSQGVQREAKRNPRNQTGTKV
jgi:hypothetical protein